MVRMVIAPVPSGVDRAIDDRAFRDVEPNRKREREQSDERVPGGLGGRSAHDGDGLPRARQQQQREQHRTNETEQGDDEGEGFIVGHSVVRRWIRRAMYSASLSA